jgi:hypothetical protein
MSALNQEGSAASPPLAGAAAAETKLVNKPEDTAFKQQRIMSWQPVMSPPCAIGTLCTVGLLFIIVGALIVVTSDNVQIVELRYDQEQNCDFWDRQIPDKDSNRNDMLNSSSGYQYWACKGVTLRFTVPKTMPQPVNIYYKIENMNQNHRTYARSQNVLQLAGESVAPADASDCTPFLRLNEYATLGGSSVVELDLDNGDTQMIDAAGAMYNPCGLVAWSMFNDSFVLRNELSNATEVICETSNYMADGTPTAPIGLCSKNDIAWSTDPGVRFSAPVSAPGSVLTANGWNINAANRSTTPTYDSGWGYYLTRGWYIGEPGHRLPNPADQDLMVWMRLALLADFRKLFRVIHQDIVPGTYSFTIFQRFDVRTFGGKKSIILTTNNWLGGQNYWLGGLYLAVGCVCSVVGLAFLVKHMTTPQLLSF